MSTNEISSNFSAPPRSFRSAIETCFSKYAIFTGRASRSEYWWFFLFGFIVHFAFFVTIGDNIFESDNLVFWLVVLSLVLPSLAVGARRLHDTNHSGWWLLLQIIPILSIVLIIFFVLKGNPEKNQYTEKKIEHD